MYDTVELFPHNLSNHLQFLFALIFEFVQRSMTADCSCGHLALFTWRLLSWLFLISLFYEVEVPQDFSKKIFLELYSDKFGLRSFSAGNLRTCVSYYLRAKLDSI